MAGTAGIIAARRRTPDARPIGLLPTPDARPIGLPPMPDAPADRRLTPDGPAADGRPTPEVLPADGRVADMAAAGIAAKPHAGSIRFRKSPEPDCRTMARMTSRAARIVPGCWRIRAPASMSAAMASRKCRVDGPGQPLA